jgi:hypothetical protein
LICKHENSKCKYYKGLNLTGTLRLMFNQNIIIHRDI